MAVDKSFVVKNGLEVNSDLIVTDISDSQNKKVGIASTGPRVTLDVRGGIAATDGNFSGILTAASVDISNFGAVRGTEATITGFSTLGGLSVDQLTVSGVATFADLSYDEISGRNLKLTGIATIPTIAGDTNVTGVVTAAQFFGGGVGVGIADSTGTVIGYGLTMLNFIGAGNTFAVDGTSVDISIAGGGGGGGGSASIGIGTTVGDAFSGIVTAGNLWYNTGEGRLFIYYQDVDSAQWVDAAPFNVGIITTLQSASFSAASAAAPSITFSNDEDSGFFQAAVNQPGVSAAGSQVARFNPGGLNVTGVVTATTFSGDATGLSGTPDITVNNITAGVITATSYSGDGAGLTGVASTDNIQTATEANFLSGVKITGVTTFSNALNLDSANSKINTGSGINVVFQDQGSDKLHFELSTQSIRPNNADNGELGNATYPFKKVTATQFAGNITGTAATFTGNVSIGGTLTYQDVTNMDVLGIGTFQQGIQVLANGVDVTGFSTFKTGVSVTGVVTATSFSGDGSALTGISAGITTESITATDRTIATLNLSKDAHKVNVSGVATIDCQGGSEYGTHILTIVNTGIATVGFSTYFLFPSGSEPSLPTASGTISQLSFTVHRVGAAGTQVLTTAALNFS